VNLNSDVSVTLRAPTSSTATVSANADRNFATDQVREMVSGFNSLMATARSNQTINPRLMNDLSGALTSFRPMLEFIGVNVSSDGTLSINEQRLAAAAQETTSGGRTSSRLQDFFSQTGTNNFASRVAGIADRAANNPSHYAARTTTPGVSAIANRGGNPTGFDPSTASQTDIINLFSGRGNMLSMYHQQANMGFLFNMFV